MRPATTREVPQQMIATILLAMKKKKKVEHRLSNLLSKIRSTPKKSKPQSKKVKKLQLKYERYDFESCDYKLVKMKDGGGPRFIDVEHPTPITFREIRRQATSLYFDNNHCNFFFEHFINCDVELSTISGRSVEETENLWDYIQRKGVCLSKTIFMLRSKYNEGLGDEDEDDLPSVLLTPVDTSSATPIDDANVDNLLSSLRPSIRRKICHICHCTYVGQECLICLQNTEFFESLNADKETEVDTFSLMMPGTSGVDESNDISTLTPIPEFSANHVSESESTSPNDISIINPTVEELRQQRLDHFMQQSANQQSLLLCAHAEVHRMNLKDDMMKLFMEAQPSRRISYVWIDSRGNKEAGIGSGVARDVYSTFWKEVSNSFLIGEKERVPFIRHDMYKEEWRSIGNIIVKGFKDTGYFPIIISKVFVYFCILGKIIERELIPSFLNYLSSDESQLVEQALAKNATTLESDEFVDFLDQFNCRSKVTIENVKNVVFEIARQELIQKPHLIATSWQECFQELRSEPEFSTIDSVKQFYDEKVPSTKKVIALFKHCVPEDNSQRDSFSFLKRYIRGLELTMLKKFMQFLTGSDILTVNKIDIDFIKPESVFSRRPIAHTCGPCLELPSTYNSFCELREEFHKILEQGDWEMDIM